MSACMDWGMVIAIVGSNIGLCAVFITVMIWIFGKLDSDIKNVASKIDEDMRAQTSRTDKLYEMFIDLVKSQKAKTDP